MLFLPAQEGEVVMEDGEEIGVLGQGLDQLGQFVSLFLPEIELGDPAQGHMEPRLVVHRPRGLRPQQPDLLRIFALVLSNALESTYKPINRDTGNP